MHTSPSIMTDGGGVEIEQRHVNYFDILQERVKAWNNIVCRKKKKHIYNNLKRLCQAFLEFIHSTSWDLIELFRKRFVTIWVWELTVPIFPRQDNRGLFDFDKLKWTVRAQLNDSQIIHLIQWETHDSTSQKQTINITTCISTEFVCKRGVQRLFILQWLINN